MENAGGVEQSLKQPLTLHHLTSAQSLRIIWALEELADKGLTYTLKVYQRVQGRAPPELKSIFPLGKCPILVVDPLPESPDSGQTIVTESRLILQYLADNYSDGIWTPSNPEDKRRSDFWQEFAGATLCQKVDFVLLYEIVPSHVPWLFRPLASAIFNPIANIFKKELPGPFALMEAALSEERPWFAGEKLGQADFCLSWPMDIAVQRGYFNAAQYPKVAEWLKRVHERPAYKRALEKGGTYDLVAFR